MRSLPAPTASAEESWFSSSRSETLDPDSRALWGNFPQTYSHVGRINTAFAISSFGGPMV